MREKGPIKEAENMWERADGGEEEAAEPTKPGGWWSSPWS